MRTPKQPLELSCVFVAVALGWMYWELAGWLVGLAAAIAAPAFAAPWISEHPWLGSLIFRFVTLVPAWTLAALPVALVFLGWRPEHVVRGALIAAVTCLCCLLVAMGDALPVRLPANGAHDWLPVMMSTVIPHFLGALMLPVLAGWMFARRLQSS